MRLSLQPHPDFPCTAVDSLEVEIARTDVLSLCYAVTGRIDQILLPAPSAPARSDELWKHTCFEAFARPAPGEAYTELNFSPSTRWAAYQFTGYRRDMREAEIPAPRIETSATGDRFELRVSVLLPVLGNSRLAISAIIEERNGAKSYWALAHPPGKPDFHHADGFVLDLR
jgi:hypothetical protein